MVPHRLDLPPCRLPRPKRPAAPTPPLRATRYDFVLYAAARENIHFGGNGKVSSNKHLQGKRKAPSPPSPAPCPLYDRRVRGMIFWYTRKRKPDRSPTG